ncbi:MAG: glutamate racemase [Vicinamibacterales bacterium]
MGAIGVFDSGVGGLSVLREIRRELPGESLLYVADSAHAPYGDKPAAFVIERSHALADFLIQQGATSLVVACNTATAVAIDALRATHTVPIIGVEPAVKPAVEQTRAGVVGVLTTSRTAMSARFSKLLVRYGGATRIAVQPCPGWVELVERGDLGGREVEGRVREYVQPLLDQGADVLVLGCTHYSFLRPAIRDIAGDGVALIDPAPAVASHLRHRLEHLNLLSPGGDAGEQIWTTAAPAALASLTGRLWGQALTVRAVPPAFAGAPDAPTS